MRAWIALLLLCTAVVSPHAGINQGGVLVVHHEPELIASDSCGELVVPGSCGELNASAAADGTPQLWFVLAAFPDSVAERLDTVVFGLGNDDDGSLVMSEWGPCAIGGTPLVIAGPGWPGPGTGTAVSWSRIRAHRRRMSS